MRRRSSTPLFLSLALALALSPAARAQTVPRGQMWEQTLTSSAPYASAWLSARVCVQYTSPVTHTVYTGLAFWDAPNGAGSDLFKIRAAFNETGLWSWALVANAGCEPPTSFSPNTGTVNVGPDATGLPLYQYGPVRVTTTGAKRYLVLSGATVLTPFLWIGDTSWSGPYIGHPATWATFTAKRKSQKFTVIETAMPINAVANAGSPTNISGAPAFVSTPGGTTPCPANTVLPQTGACYPNKAFWDAWDAEIANVNANGMLAVVVGLFKRVDESVATWPTAADSQGYARWAAARLAGYYTALSPGFDGLPARSDSLSASCTGVVGSAVNLACRARLVGTAIRDATPESTSAPLTALVTHHIGGGCPVESPPNSQCLADYWLLQFQSETWLDFQLFQSGQGDNVGPSTLCTTQLSCLAERASQRPFMLYGATPTKPIVDGEAIYDQFSTPSNLYSDVRARQTALYALLSGGVGFTHGIGGTWDWAGYATGFSASTGINAPSADEIGAIGQLFAPFRWNRLMPDCQPWAVACSQIKDNQASLAPESRRLFARDSNGLFAVAFLPGSSATPLASVTLDLSGLPTFTPTGGSWISEWYDPARRCYCTATATGSGPYTFASPQSSVDWALLLHDTMTVPPPATLPACNTPSGGVVSCAGR